MSSVKHVKSQLWKYQLCYDSDSQAHLCQFQLCKYQLCARQDPARCNILYMINFTLLTIVHCVLVLIFLPPFEFILSSCLGKKKQMVKRPSNFQTWQRTSHLLWHWDVKNTTFLGFAVFEKWSCYKLSPFDIQNFSSTLGEKEMLFGKQEMENLIMSTGKKQKREKEKP